MRAPTNVQKLFDLVGTDAPTAYRDLILAHTDVVAITVCRYRTPPLLQQRIRATPFEQEIIAIALDIRSEVKIPFWEAIFAACLRAGKCSDPLIDAALFHNGLGDLTTISAKSLKLDGLKDIVASGQSNIGLASRVELSDVDAHHLAMMDFHCSITEENTEIVASICRRLMPNGFLMLDSGDSYHACGVVLLTEEERLEFLSKSLFFAPIVDSSYIAHQLMQPMSSIRISTGGSRTKCPEVLRVEVHA